MNPETQNERQIRLDTELSRDRNDFLEFKQYVGSRFDRMDIVLAELHDDLKLRRWLVRFAKSALLITLAILSFLHAPQWLHHLLGVEVTPHQK